jgi:hypothetical protein
VTRPAIREYSENFMVYIDQNGAFTFFHGESPTVKYYHIIAHQVILYSVRRSYAPFKGSSVFMAIDDVLIMTELD